MRSKSRLVAALAVLLAGCASDTSRRLDAIDARLTAIEATLAPTRPSASVAELAESARIARARRDAIVTNLANADTAGFKRREIREGEALRIDMAQGPMENTDRQLDVAINGPGLFRVKTADGVAYTRRGNFFVNNASELILGTKEGPRLMPTIAIPAGSTTVNVADDGTIEAVGDSNQVTAVGRFELVRFTNAEGLKPIGRDLFVETPASGAPAVGHPKDAGFGDVQQGFLERSNVEPLAERVRLADVERSLEWIERTLARYEPLTTSSARPAR